MLGHLCSKVLKQFKMRLEKSLKEGSFDSSVSASCIESPVREFDEGCEGNGSIYVSDTSNLYPLLTIHLLADATIQKANWDSSSIRKKLVCDIEEHALHVHDVMLSKLKDKCEVMY